MVHPLTRPLAALAAATVALTAAIPTLTLAEPADASPAPSVPAGPAVSGATQDQARRALAGMPLAFEVNRGQTHQRVRYLARGAGFNLYLTRHRAVFDLGGAAVGLEPVGTDRAPRPVGRSPQRATTSYFRGNDPSTWQRGVPGFGRVRYPGLYRGIDLVFRGERSGAEYDFVVAPGADPSRIGYRLQGADRLRLRGGDLVASTAAGDFVHHAPVAYQRIDGRRATIEAQFRLRHGVVSFALGSYDRSRPLVIDPETDLEYSTYLGGTGNDSAVAIVVRDGDAYVAGTTYAPDFPTTPGAYDTTPATSDAFVSRLSLDGNGAADLVYSTVLGGGYYDYGSDLAVEDGDVYLSGATESSNFPTTTGAYDREFYGSDGGGSESFLAKISPDGAGNADLAYSTYVGANFYVDGAAAIAVHDGDAYLAGATDAPAYPTTPGALHHDYDGGVDIFLTRISPDGAGEEDLKYGAIFGGPGDEGAVDIAFSRGDVYLAGTTYYKGFPTTPEAYDRSYNGEYDVFVARVSPDGNRRADMKYATLLGTPAYDVPTALAVRDGKVYLTGYTKSARFPTTRRAYDRSYNGRGDAFLAVLATNRAVRRDLRYSTFFGGGRGDSGSGIRVSDGEVYVVGSTESPGLPTTKGAYDRSHNGRYDAFVAMFDPDGARRRDLDYATFLGGPRDDAATALAVDGASGYVTGSAGMDFPTTTDAFDTTFDHAGDAFLTLLHLPTAG
jgi:hypothetical protein